MDKVEEKRKAINEELKIVKAAFNGRRGAILKNWFRKICMYDYPLATKNGIIVEPNEMFYRDGRRSIYIEIENKLKAKEIKDAGTE